MNVTMNHVGSMTQFNIEGRIDTTTAPVLEHGIDQCLEETEELVLNLKDVEYISSAGLRVILKTHKAMNGKNGLLKITGASEDIMEIFDMTGFLDFLNVESK